MVKQWRVGECPCPSRVPNPAMRRQAEKSLLQWWTDYIGDRGRNNEFCHSERASQSCDIWLGPYRWLGFTKGWRQRMASKWGWVWTEARGLGIWCVWSGSREWLLGLCAVHDGVRNQWAWKYRQKKSAGQSPKGLATAFTVSPTPSEGRWHLEPNHFCPFHFFPANILLS